MTDCNKSAYQTGGTRKRRGKKPVKVKASTMRKHAKHHSRRHIAHMKKMMKKGYPFRKAHRSATRKVGK
jgi:argininosuccinate lyase